MRIAITYNTPVILLSDGYLANGSEPWNIPSEDSLPEIGKAFAKEGEPYLPYERDPETLARTQAIPGQVGLEHRLGGLEKDVSGAISYDPENHSEMTRLRAAKVEAIAKTLPELIIRGKETGKLLVIGWGGTHGSIASAIDSLHKEGFDNVTSVNLRHLNPLPSDLEALVEGFEKVLIPELNSGQLAMIIRSKFLVDAQPMNKIKGRPFKVNEVRERILELLND